MINFIAGIIIGLPVGVFALTVYLCDSPLAAAFYSGFILSSKLGVAPN